MPLVTLIKELNDLLSISRLGSIAGSIIDPYASLNNDFSQSLLICF